MITKLKFFRQIIVSLFYMQNFFQIPGCLMIFVKSLGFFLTSQILSYLGFFSLNSEILGLLSTLYFKNSNSKAFNLL